MKSRIRSTLNFVPLSLCAFVPSRFYTFPDIGEQEEL